MWYCAAEFGDPCPPMFLLASGPPSVTLDNGSTTLSFPISELFASESYVITLQVSPDDPNYQSAAVSASTSFATTQNEP